MMRALCLVFCLLLTGCGTTYSVSVNSLAADINLPPSSTCFLKSAMHGVSEQDLLFREVGLMLAPALGLQGLTVTNDESAASCIVRVAYAEGQPVVTWETENVSVEKPVIIREGNKTKVEYVRVEEPRLTTRTTYNASLMVEAYLKAKNGRLGEPVWKSTVVCSGPDNDLRTLLNKMGPVLPGTLGVRSSGPRNFEVYVEDGGVVSVNEVLPGRLW